MWRIFNKLFRWDYIHWSSNYSSIYNGISRIHKDAEGKSFYAPYGFKGPFEYLTETSHKLSWLTCKSEKYLEGKK